jgi:hypothetical protein
MRGQGPSTSADKRGGHSLPAAKPRYSDHAKLRMAQRSISEAEVEATLDQYHTSYPDKNGNSIMVAHVNGRRIKVVQAKDSQPPFIITTAD